MTVKEVFSRIYETNHWCGSESRSGVGSGLAHTAVLRRELPALLAHYKIATVLDAGCGDYYWLRQTPLGVKSYLGVDIVDTMIAENQTYASDGIAFECLDITRDPLPKVDLILCRDVLVHLSVDDIRLAMRNFVASGSTYLLTTTFPSYENQDLTGAMLWRPLNFELSPFRFPPPLALLNEQYEDPQFDDKSLGLWRLNP